MSAIIKCHSFHVYSEAPPVLPPSPTVVMTPSLSCYCSCHPSRRGHFHVCMCMCVHSWMCMLMCVQVHMCSDTHVRMIQDVRMSSGMPSTLLQDLTVSCPRRRGWQAQGFALFLFPRADKLTWLTPSILREYWDSNSGLRVCIRHFTHQVHHPLYCGKFGIFYR